MKKEKINAFKKEFRELLKKHKVTIDITRDADNDGDLKVFMKDENKGYYAEIMDFPEEMIHCKSPELDIF